jgi:hypothetical protein
LAASDLVQKATLASNGSEATRAGASAGAVVGVLGLTIIAGIVGFFVAAVFLTIAYVSRERRT